MKDNKSLKQLKASEIADNVDLVVVNFDEKRGQKRASRDNKAQDESDPDDIR